MAGSVVMTRDGLDRLTSIDYADNYSDSNNSRNTRAYPTKVTDADSYYSTVQYNYDMGAATRTEDPKGAAQTIAYDWVGRIDRVTNVVNSAYTRYVYPNSSNIVQSFTTVQDSAGEAYSVSTLDGAGRVRGTASDHPGSTGLYSGQYAIYDNMDACLSSRIRRKSIAVGRQWEMTLPGFIQCKCTTGKAGRL